MIIFSFNKGSVTPADRFLITESCKQSQGKSIKTFNILAITGLYFIKTVLSSGFFKKNSIIPPIAVIKLGFWDSDKTCTELSLFGQYSSRVFYALNLK